MLDRGQGTVFAHWRELSFLLCASVFLALIGIGLVIPLFSGFLFYTLTCDIGDSLAGRRISLLQARLASGVAVVATTCLILAAAVAIAHVGLQDGIAVKELGFRMGGIISSARAWLPAQISSMLPEANTIFLQAGTWVHVHAGALSVVGFDAIKQVGYFLVGMLLGVMISISSSGSIAAYGPLSESMLRQIASLRGAFWRVVMAQVKISALNTLLTGVYLMVVLPLLGIHLGMVKTLVVMTFLVGLLPIVGNLISNSAITIISLGYSLPVAVGSLGFLVIVHKLEYFVNASIVGSRIQARAWEILLAMLLMERFFGLAGVFSAPIFYAWLKSEWHAWDRSAIVDTPS
jgi:predicted PurR-regulated permease PerM